MMPFPAERLHSLTHVRYTPHVSWTDEPGAPCAEAALARTPVESRWRHMIHDARRYLPAVTDAIWKKSLFEVKTVLTKNELLSGLIGGIFLVESVSVIIQVWWYKATGKRIFLMAPIHHHFEKMGWPEPRIIVRFWIISVLLALVALSSMKLR